MDLVLWRHAEAVESAGGAGDLERALTPKGKRQAAAVAAWLDRQLPRAARVLVSPARRAQQTAEALGRRFATVDMLAPGGSVDDVLGAARWPDARGAVLVVGHQPMLGMTCAFLVTGRPQPWTIRKAGVVWLRARERGSALQVVLQAVIGPDQL